jgi:hypothetical protein
MAGREESPWGGGGMDWSSGPTKPRENLPVSVAYNGRDVSIYTFQQIDRIGKNALKERSMNLRDLFGAAKLPRFSPGMPDEQMVAWLLEAQTIVAAACGISLTVSDLGAPKGGEGVGAYLTHLANAPPPVQQQFQQQQQQQYQQQAMPQQQQQQDVYMVESILDVRTDPSGLASQFFVKWAGRPMEEASWEAAGDIQTAAPRAVAAFKQQFQQMQQQQRQPPSQQSFPPQQQGFEATDLRGNPLRSPQPFSPLAGSPMRPDQEADLAREAARKRNQGSNPFG